MESELNVDKAEPDDDFVWLGWLLAAGTPIGVAASAIEGQGIYGEDRFGRFKYFKATSAEAEEVLKMLAARYQRVSNPQYEHDPATGDPVDDPFDRYGWPTKKSPDFASIAREVKPAPWGAPDSAPASALLVLGAVLGTVIKGKDSPGRKAFTSQSQLIESLDLEWPSVRGLSKRNLEGVFASAAKAFEDRLKGRSPPRR